MKTLDQLREVFNQPPITGTARVMSRPAVLSPDLVKRVVNDMEMRQIVRDLAAISAREVGNQLLGVGLKPSDYAVQEDLQQLVLTRLRDTLKTDSEQFISAFVEFLALRG